MIVGGWADGYTNAAGRMIAGLTAAGVPCRGLIGPWSHGWPEVADPGPRIGFLQECVRWWDHWLKDEDSGAMDVPVLRAWIQDYVKPASFYSARPGRWVGEDEWPSPRVEPETMFASADGQLSPEPGNPGVLEHRGSERSGSHAGAWCPYGHAGDLPTDQRAENGLALPFSTPTLLEPLEILGHPVAVLELTADRPRALVAVRLCDVAPDGTSLLVSRGLLNLSHRDGHAEPRPVVPREPMVVQVPLDLALPARAPHPSGDLLYVLAVRVALTRAGDARDLARRAHARPAASPAGRPAGACARGSRARRARAGT